MTTLDGYYAHPLYKFLQGYTVQARQGQEASLCGMGKIKARWLIPDDKYEEFHNLLGDYLFGKKGRPINLVEQPRLDAVKPLLIDLDFRFPLNTSLSHRFNGDNIDMFIQNVSEGIKTLFYTGDRESCRFFVSLRPQAYENAKKYIKDGIHIQSPDICLTNDKQKVLRLWLLENEAIKNSFDGIGYTNEPGDIYDESMVRKQGWFLYGESKPDISPYVLEKVLSYNLSTGDLEEEDLAEYTPRKLLKLLSVRYDLQKDTNDIRDKKVFDKYLNYRPLPPPSLETVANAKAEPQDAEKPPVHTVATYIPDNYDCEEVEIAKRIAIECLSKKRADDYKTWIETGWCLANIDSSEEMFEVFKLFSAKSEKSAGTDWAKIKREWIRGFSRDTAGAKLTLKSLHFWAREDSPKEYAEIVEEDLVRYAQYRVDDTHYHVAKLLHRMYKGLFCASVESRRTEWYRFDPSNHTWRHTNQGMELQAKLSTEVADLIVRARQRLKMKGWEKHREENNIASATAIPDEDWYKKWATTLEGERFQSLVKVEKNLYKQDFKGSVMRAAVEIFHEEDFASRLNMNTTLLACKNGVLDLQNEIRDASGATRKIVVFRDGRPDDYMSNLAGRTYPEHEAIDYLPHDPEDPNFLELKEFLEKIFPNPDLCAFMVRLMASCLEGCNREQCYYTLIGGGGNGKSKLTDLMKNTLGEYCGSLAATALTRKRPESGAANPDIIGIKNKRFIVLQEPDPKEPLNTSRMKQFSGEDLVEARGLFEDQQRFRITGKLFMCCNELPPINAMDRGTWRRIRVLPFMSSFYDKDDPRLNEGNPRFFPKDDALDAKLLRWRTAWLGYLVHIYETQYLVHGLTPIPALVMQESNKYKEAFDQYGKFKTERMLDFRDVRSKLQEYGNEEATLKDVCMSYNNWTRQNEGTLVGKKLTKQELQKRLEDDYGNMENGVFRRCVVFSDDEGKAEFEKERESQP